MVNTIKIFPDDYERELSGGRQRSKLPSNQKSTLRIDIGQPVVVLHRVSGKNVSVSRPLPLGARPASISRQE